jgi:hypothetical protein
VSVPERTSSNSSASPNHDANFAAAASAPESSTRPHHALARLAVHAGRVPRRTADDRADRLGLSRLAQRPARRGGARAGRARRARENGGPRRVGHVRARKRAAMAAADLATGVHGDRELLRHGLGGNLDRHLRRPADRRRTGRLGPELVVAVALPRTPRHARQVLGAGDRPGRRDHQLRLLDRQRATRRRPLERWHQLWRRARVYLRRP